MKTISIFSDGSSAGDAKSPIGWSWIVTDGEVILGAGAQGAPIGTNNIAELSGAIDGLKWVYDKNLHIGNAVELVSDSTYTLGIANGTFQPQKNLELAAIARQAFMAVNATTRWIKGHAGDPFNEKCDKLAKHAKSKYLPPKPPRTRKRSVERARKRELKKAYVESINNQGT